MLNAETQEKRFGPFILSRVKDIWSPFGVTLNSCNPYATDVERDYNYLKIYAFGYMLIVLLPNILKTYTDESNRKYDRSYGFLYNDGSLTLNYGIQKDLPEGKHKTIFFPWRKTRIERITYIGRHGLPICVIMNPDTLRGSNKKLADIHKGKFLLQDFDGTEVVARTMIEEVVRKVGVGKYKWLSWFFRDKIYRYLNIEFDKAIGKEKESWKGGIIYATYCLEKEKTHLEGILSFCIKENRRHIRFIRELS